jgi:MOSC domain-containing protein YiiM
MLIHSINIGQPQLRPRNGVELLTGGDKLPVASADLHTLGFAGDGQADTANHGGPDRAVCVYAFDHYPYWEQRLGRNLTPGAFSENLTVQGIDEKEVCIGDVFRAGGALVQVSLPRTPCSKLAGKHGEPQLAKWVADANATGFYMRVLEEGHVAAGDPFTRVQAHPERISVAAVVDIIFDRSRDAALIARLLQMPEFGDTWSGPFRKRLEKLTGPTQPPAQSPTQSPTQ